MGEGDWRGGQGRGKVMREGKRGPCLEVFQKY